MAGARCASPRIEAPLSASGANAATRSCPCTTRRRTPQLSWSACAPWPGPAPASSSRCAHGARGGLPSSVWEIVQGHCIHMQMRLAPPTVRRSWTTRPARTSAPAWTPPPRAWWRTGTPSWCVRSTLPGLPQSTQRPPALSHRPSFRDRAHGAALLTSPPPSPRPPPPRCPTCAPCR